MTELRDQIRADLERIYGERDPIYRRDDRPSPFLKPAETPQGLIRYLYRQIVKETAS